MASVAGGGRGHIAGASTLSLGPSRIAVPLPRASSTENGPLHQANRDHIYADPLSRSISAFGTRRTARAARRSPDPAA